jgi:5-methylcytosine-specific restriction endonuclease McrA
MSHVFVVDTKRQPLHPIHPGYARRLLNTGKAAVLKRYPFTIVLKSVVEQPTTQPLRVKIDPGSKVTGLAIVNDATGAVVFAAELTHRGEYIKKRLEKRHAARRSRRQRKTRYRQPRWDNRRNKKQGWLPPSLESRIANIITWVQRLRRYCPIAAISQELVRFDMQAMENPEISGAEYQQGTLQGYELREYLLEKWNRQCAYCCKRDIPLQIEHIQARANAGTNQISNLTLACEQCNSAKGTQPIEQFLKKKPELLKKLLAQAKAPLKDAAAVNATRWSLYERLKQIGLPVECGSGGLTKFNRTQRAFPKTHWLDASCVGKRTPEVLKIEGIVPLLITANGHGNRQMCLINELGFPRGKAKANKKVKGFQTGDMVRAVVTKGKKIGTYIGRVAVRSTGSFNIKTKAGIVEGIGSQYCQSLHHLDGYSYQVGKALPACGQLSFLP